MGLVMLRPGSAWKPQARPGFPRLRLVKVRAWAVCAGSGSAQAGLGSSRGFQTKIIKKEVITVYQTNKPLQLFFGYIVYKSVNLWHLSCVLVCDGWENMERDNLCSDRGDTGASNIIPKLGWRIKRWTVWLWWWLSVIFLVGKAAKNHQKIVKKVAEYWWKAAAQAAASGFNKVRPEPWAQLGLCSGSARLRLLGARLGRLQALKPSRSITRWDGCSLLSRISLK